MNLSVEIAANWSPESRRDALYYLLGYLGGLADSGNAQAARAVEEFLIYGGALELLAPLPWNMP